MPRRSTNSELMPAFDFKAAREACGFSQSEAARVLFTSQSSVARWETTGKLPQIYRAYWSLWLKHAHKPVRSKRNDIKKDAKHSNNARASI